MSSINTNVAAMTALQTLSRTNENLTMTQGRIATGFRVATATDNAAYWAIATTMRSDNKAMSTVQDALGLGAATVDVAYTALESSLEVVDEIKSKLVAAREPGIDRVKIQSEIGELQLQLQSISDSATFNGENFLTVDSTAGITAKEVVASFTRTGSAVSVGTISIDITSTTLFDSGADTGILDTVDGGTAVSISTLDISALTDSAADLATLDALISQVDAGHQLMTTAAADLGSASKRIDLQQNFVNNLMDAIDRGIGQLVDADLNEESTKLQALQVQQQLGIQALSIANSTSQNILSLFR